MNIPKASQREPCPDSMVWRLFVVFEITLKMGKRHIQSSKWWSITIVVYKIDGSSIHPHIRPRASSYSKAQVVQTAPRDTVIDAWKYPVHYIYMLVPTTSIIYSRLYPE